MTSAFQSIGNSLGDIVASRAGSVSAPGGGTAGGGKFAFDPDELEAITKDWLALAMEYRESAADGRRLIIRGPGREDASDGQALAAMQSWGTYVESLQQKRDYSMEQARKCASALAAYRGTDQDSILRLLSPAGAAPTAGGI
ncbi:hypothetical protein L6E12_18985 [Actinokineospora sp. PR83]|uniref:hypothetical protein n=1 Tax=Actinokineospora sp. PR83 TaxID=2884908 RepID=UPI001F3147FB|nr:hypothetical protein [Actinokineospora sp. PR83]MCG8917869.1 hypothetical protein [Actinokineospora sp. PR83]